VKKRARKKNAVKKKIKRGFVVVVGTWSQFVLGWSSSVISACWCCSWCFLGADSDWDTAWLVWLWILVTAGQQQQGSEEWKINKVITEGRW
jgi:hypothetical protein